MEPRLRPHPGDFREPSQAWISLAETLAVMSAYVIREASITVSLQGSMLGADGTIEDAERAPMRRAAIEALANAARRTHAA
jgi:hypothetical protein